MFQTLYLFMIRKLCFFADNADNYLYENGNPLEQLKPLK